MKIKRVYARDFLSYQVLDLSLSDLGLCLVEGENQDTGGSNGSGKSSIFEAVVWCLFGKTTKGVGADEVIRHDALHEPVIGETCVCVTIEEDGEVYEVYRHRKHKQHGNKCMMFVNSKDRTSSTDSATQKLINQLLRLDYKSFVSSVMYPQKAQNFVDMTDTERKAVFSKLIGTERFSEACDRAKAAVKQVTAATQAALQKKSALIGSMDTCYNQISRMEENVGVWERERVKQILRKEEEAENLLAQEMPVVDPQWLQRLEELKQKTSVELKPYRDRFDELTELSTKLLTSRANLQQQVNYIDSLPDDFTEEEKQEPEKSEEELQLEASSFGNAKIQAETELRFVREELQKIKFELAEQGDYTHCETCGQELSEEARVKLFGDLGSRIDELNDRQELLTAKVEEYAAKQKGIQEQYEKARKYSSYLGVLKWKAARPPLVADLEEVDKKIKAQAQEKAEITELCNSVINAYNEKGKIENQINAVEQQIERQKSAISVLHREVANLQAAENPHVKVLEELKSTIGDLQAQYDAIIADIEVEEKKLAKLKFWAEGFGKNGVECVLFDHAIPSLNERANLYLSELTEGQAFIWFDTQKTLASGETREAFAVKVSFAGAGQNLRQVSGGEAQRVNLATTLALGDMCAERSNAPVSLRLLDEPFESLDSVGAEQVVKLLDNRIVPTSGTVLVMTHDENLKSLVPNRIKVLKTGGISSVV